MARVRASEGGNDFSKLYAPLLRDGRMEKYYWDPTDDDIVEILLQMFKDDGFSRREMLTFRRAFPEQALDFFGAVRAATVDREVKKWVLGTMGHSYGELSRRGLGLDPQGLQEKACHSMGSRLLDRRLGPVTLDVDKVTVDDLLREGRRLELEQERVRPAYALSEPAQPGPLCCAIWEMAPDEEASVFRFGNLNKEILNFDSNLKFKSFSICSLNHINPIKCANCIT